MSSMMHNTARIHTNTLEYWVKAAKRTWTYFKSLNNEVQHAIKAFYCMRLRHPKSLCSIEVGRRATTLPQEYSNLLVNRSR